MQYITAETAWGVGEVTVAAVAAAAVAVAIIYGRIQVRRAVAKCRVDDDLYRTVLVVYVDEVALM